MANYTAIFEQAEDGTWGGYFPDLAVILVNGSTLEEAQENARTGLEMWIEDRKELGCRSRHRRSRFWPSRLPREAEKIVAGVAEARPGSRRNIGMKAESFRKDK